MVVLVSVLVMLVQLTAVVPAATLELLVAATFGKVSLGTVAVLRNVSFYSLNKS